MEIKVYKQNKKEYLIYDFFRIIINFLNLKYDLTQYKWGRSLYGGTWFLMRNWLITSDFWSEKSINSCGGQPIRIEKYMK